MTWVISYLKGAFMLFFQQQSWQVIKYTQIHLKIIVPLLCPYLEFVPNLWQLQHKRRRRNLIKRWIFQERRILRQRLCNFDWFRFLIAYFDAHFLLQLLRFDIYLRLTGDSGYSNNVTSIDQVVCFHNVTLLQARWCSRHQAPGRAVVMSFKSGEASKEGDLGALLGKSAAKFWGERSDLPQRICSQQLDGLLEVRNFRSWCCRP